MYFIIFFIEQFDILDYVVGKGVFILLLGLGDCFEWELL